MFGILHAAKYKQKTIPKERETYQFRMYSCAVACAFIRKVYVANCCSFPMREIYNKESVYDYSFMLCFSMISCFLLSLTQLRTMFIFCLMLLFSFELLREIHNGECEYDYSLV